MEKSTFDTLGLSPEILDAVTAKGFTEPSPIQAQVIPLLLKGKRDIIGQAQTGTGKTAAFALPLLQLIDAKARQTQAIILVPTRELAMQVSAEIASFRVPASPTVTVVYGGNNMHTERSALSRNPHIVVGTPGRVQHHIRSGSLNLKSARYFVLDEADEMLNFGFREEIEKILAQTPKERRVLLFSATMPKSILQIVQSYMGEHDRVTVKASEMTNKNITQQYYCVKAKDKFEALCQIIEHQVAFYAIVFCRTKNETDLIASQLAARHVRAEAIHGDIDQSQREKVLSRFRNGAVQILVATDVAARGIDVTDLDFVVNFSLPDTYEAYTHRIGRTGRAGKAGVAMTFITRAQMSRLRFYEQKLGVRLEKGKLPTPGDIVAKKQLAFIERLEHTLNIGAEKKHLGLARDLLTEVEPENVVAALLADAYGNDFDANHYRKIEDDGTQHKAFGGGGDKQSSYKRSGSSRGRQGGGGKRGKGGGGSYSDKPYNRQGGKKKKRR
jgi:ATP-dependent RNA helicase DeaD